MLSSAAVALLLYQPLAAVAGFPPSCQVMQLGGLSEEIFSH
jgi:hypothetical protein